MSPKLDTMLEKDILPRLRAAAPGIPKTPTEDDAEIVQDTCLMAARMMVAAEKAGRPFTPATIAYFATQAARSGRRSYSAGRSDVHSPGCLLDGRARLESLDAPPTLATDDEPGAALHDVLAPFGEDDHESDPAEEGGRNLDWAAFFAAHPRRHRVAVTVLATGGSMRDAGRRCGIKDAAAFNLKRKIAADLLAFFGEDVIRRLLGGVRPCWESNLRAVREKHLCHADAGASGTVSPWG